MGKFGRRGTFATAAIVTASVLATMLQGPVATAAPQPKAKVTAKVNKKYAQQAFTPLGSGTSGGKSGDIDLAGKDDILAVVANPPDLKVYPNKGYNAATPTATYGAPVTINTGWAGQKWVGQGKINGDAHPDVLAIDNTNTLYVHKHSGTFNGTSTLNGVQQISTGWDGTDLIFVHDVNKDGIDDVVARKTGTDEFYVYLTSVVNGVVKQAPGELLIGFEASSPILDAAMADFTGDNVADWVLRLQNGAVVVYDPTVSGIGDDYVLSFGWTGMNAFTISDVNGDKKPDILGRVASNGNLNAYLNTGTWSPAADGTAYNTLAAPAVVSLQWNGIRIIT